LRSSLWMSEQEGLGKRFTKRSLLQCNKFINRKEDGSSYLEAS
jgi:hypothetical protein